MDFLKKEEKGKIGWWYALRFQQNPLFKTCRPCRQDQARTHATDAPEGVGLLQFYPGFAGRFLTVNSMGRTRRPFACSMATTAALIAF
jgi:hypothetical protein